MDGRTRALGPRVLLTGASGFVGWYLGAALEAARHDVRRASRKPPRQAKQRWIEVDVERPETVEAALDGCEIAYYLVHQLGAGRDYPEREAKAALAFRSACEARGVRRIVYLGGPMPRGVRPSAHLESRRRTGEILAGGRISTIELRAAMIIGAGSGSWRILRDLAQRLPLMLLPRWSQFVSWPVAIDDVVAALLVAGTLPEPCGGCYDLPGPERITHFELLRRAAKLLGKRPWLFSVPLLTPALSAYWIAAVTRVDLSLTRELLQGLKGDLDPNGESFWQHLPRRSPLPLDEAMRRAIEDIDDDGERLPIAGQRMAALARALTSR